VGRLQGGTSYCSWNRLGSSGSWEVNNWTTKT
jgi:hypothetical protein